MNPERSFQLWQRWRQLNRRLALAAGLGLLGLAGWVMLDLIARRFGHSLGGTDEISGYAMALVTAWGMGYALCERNHVRIEVLRESLPGTARALLDLLAGTALALVVSAVLWRGWPVLARSWANDSRANTPLETPLWAVQAPWLAGWLWFAFGAWLAVLVALRLWIAGRHDRREAIAGTAPDGAQEQP